MYRYDKYIGILLHVDVLRTSKLRNCMAIVSFIVLTFLIISLSYFECIGIIKCETFFEAVLCGYLGWTDISFTILHTRNRVESFFNLRDRFKELKHFTLKQKVLALGLFAQKSF